MHREERRDPPKLGRVPLTVPFPLKTLEFKAVFSHRPLRAVIPLRRRIPLSPDRARRLVRFHAGRRFWFKE